jgi:hypothetical protein
MAPSRRIEDRIRDLCARLESAPECELVQILSELHATTHEYTRRTENRISATILSWRTLPPERRKTWARVLARAPGSNGDQ